MLANGSANLDVLSYEEPIIDAFTEVHTLNILKNLQGCRRKGQRRWKSRLPRPPRPAWVDPRLSRIFGGLAPLCRESLGLKTRQTRPQSPASGSARSSSSRVASGPPSLSPSCRNLSATTTNVSSQRCFFFNSCGGRLMAVTTKTLLIQLGLNRPPLKSFKHCIRGLEHCTNEQIAAKRII